jgi:hypothetical protein
MKNDKPVGRENHAAEKNKSRNHRYGPTIGFAWSLAAEIISCGLILAGLVYHMRVLKKTLPAGEAVGKMAESVRIAQIHPS